MTWLIGLALKTGIAPRFAKAAVIAVLVALAIAAFFTAKALYDSSIIEEHDTKREIKIERADRAADTKAAGERRVDDARIRQEESQLKKVQDNATSDLDRRLARHRCLRLQQGARRDGRVAPACA